MGAEHSRVSTVASTAKPNADAGSPSVSWKHLAFGFQYTATDVAVWPQCLPLLMWFTEQDALVLYERLQQRPGTRFLSIHEFRSWLSNTEGDRSVGSVLHPLRLPVAPNDVMTPPAVVLKPDSKPPLQQPHASSLLMMDLYLEHVFSTFARGNKLFAMEFLAAMVLGSRAIWSVEHKRRVLLTLFQDTANSSALHPKHQKQQIFKEADLAQLFLCVMHGVCRLTVGIEALWRRQGLDISTLARQFASNGVKFALTRRESTDNQVCEAPRAKVAVTASELRAFIDATPAFHRFLALFSGEEMRNPFTFGVARSPSDGLFYPESYWSNVAQQRQSYDRLLQQYVSFEGRDTRRQHSAAMLIQSTWRRRCSRSQLERKREAQQQRRHDSVVMLQNFLRQCQFAKVLEQHAEAETNALNGGVFVAGQGPCVPTASSQPAPLRLVETFKLLNVKISAVAMSRTCALALQSDRQSIFVWGRCLPRVYAETIDAPGASESAVTLTQRTPGKLAFRFPSSTPVLQLACGLSHALVVTEDGNVFSWGFNDHGQLGHGSSATLLARTNGEKSYSYYYDERDAREYEYLPQPTKLVYFQGAVQQQADPIPIQSVVCGDYYSMALSRDGDVFTWGEASEGQLGHGDVHTSFEVGFVDKHMLNSAYTYLPEPEPVLALSDRRVVQIACRKNHSVALTEDGRVFEWGNWGKRCGIDKEHAFAPVEMDERLVRPLQLRQISVGDHHMIGEGSSVWLTIGGRVDGLSMEKRVYLACSPSWSCGQDVLDSEYAGKKWTCVFTDCDVDDIELSVEPALSGDASASEAEADVEPASEDNHTLWKKRALPFELREPTQIASYDSKFAHVFHSFPGLARKFNFERMLMLWFHTHVQNRLVVMPRGAPAGFYLQIMLPVDTSDPVKRVAQDEAELDAPHATVVPPMVEFPVFGSSTARGKATKCGFATHLYHSVMRERLSALPRRLRKVMPMDFMEPNSLFITEFDESSFDIDESEANDEESDRQSRYFTRSATPDGKQVFEWSTLVVDTMTRRVLAAQESGALAVLLVLDFLDADAFELELAEDSGVYIPVFMIKKSTQAARSPESSPDLSFGDVLNQFVASQAFEETEGTDEPPVTPPAWVSRCFERLDTTNTRIQSALASGAAGVILIQHEQSTEVDGETRGAPIFLASPLTSTQATGQKLVAMISHESSSHLRAASALALTTRAMPFVKSDEDGAKCELLVDVGIEIRPGGTVYAWGNGQNGRLGVGNPVNAPLRDGYEALTDSVYRFADKPTPVMALAGHEMRQIVCGSAHNVAVTEVGRVFTWGKGTRGELANTKTKNQAVRDAHDQWIPRILHHLRYDRIVEAAANDASTALLSELVEPQVYLQRRKELVQLKAAARKSLIP